MADKDYFKMVQNFEQASAMMEPFANFIGVYFKNLIDNGFAREEALQLVQNFQILIFNKAFDSVGDSLTEEE
jgi:hypothetical protein